MAFERFRFLGTGTSAGVPSIGCACRVCKSSDPRDTRLRTSACVRWIDAQGNPRVLLIDTGPDLRQQSLAAGLNRLDGILFTHNHVDHTFGLDDVRRFNAVQRAPIEIYAESSTLDFLRRVYQHIFDPAKNINQSFVATLIAHRVEPWVPLEIHGLRITPLRFLHGKLPVLGFRFDLATPGATAASGGGDDPAVWAHPFPLAYCTDISAVPTETWRYLKGLRTLVLDALRYRAHPTHLTIGQAVSIAHEVNADRTYFVHMAHEVKHEECEAELPERIHLAWDGLELGVEPAVTPLGGAASDETGRVRGEEDGKRSGEGNGGERVDSD